MRRRLAGLAGAVCGLSLAMGCTSGAVAPVGQDRVYGPQPRHSAPVWPGVTGVEIGDQPTRWWPLASARDLNPTGIDVVASSDGVEEMVVDGAGIVWVDMSWGLVRLDPATWSARTWDAGDDVAFVGNWFVRASAASGVWLVEQERARLFDGVSLVRDIHVPTVYLRDGEERIPWPQGIRDLVEVGSELWIASEAGVARCDGHSWSMVGEGQLTGVESLELTPWGEVWAGSQTGWGPKRWMRYDGSRWTQIDTPDGSDVHTVAGDPTGGIVAASDLEVLRYDGSTWQTLLQLDDNDGEDGEDVWVRAVAASGDGTAWVIIGEAGQLLRSRTNGDWYPVASSGEVVDMAVSGDEVLVSSDAGAYRVAGDALELVWSPQQRWAVVPDITDVVTASGDEAWIVVGDWPEEGPPALSLQRVQIGRPDPVPVGSLPASAVSAYWPWTSTSLGSAAVVASDGAIWYVTDDSVARIADGTESVVARRHHGEGLIAGDDGAVWLAPMPRIPWWLADAEEGEQSTEADWDWLCLLTPDGQCTPVMLPAPATGLMSLVGGAGGHLWATVCQGVAGTGRWPPPCRGGGHLMHRDAEWIPVAYPGADVTGIGAAPDGGFWGILAATTEEFEQGVLAHYREGRWTTFPELARADDYYYYYDYADYVVTPAGSVCRIADAEHTLICVDTSLKITRTPVGVSGRVTVAVDGALWVDDGWLARAPITVP